MVSGKAGFGPRGRLPRASLIRRRSGLERARGRRDLLDQTGGPHPPSARRRYQAIRESRSASRWQTYRGSRQPGAITGGKYRGGDRENRSAVAAIEPGKGWKIHLISAQGDNPEPLTPDDDNEYGPGWSPDGHTLIFWKGERFLGKTAIYLFDLKTKAVSELPGSKGLFSPRWSPKGDYIAALPAKYGKGLMLYDLYKQAWAEMINMNVAYPSWSRDGNYIYFRSSYQNDPAVFRAGVRDRKPERWASLKGMQRASGSFGPWMGLTPDGSVLMLRDTGIQNIYAFDFEPRYIKVAQSN